ncbi:efflux RND transporter periplasmic adaptor subunit [Candidatus Fermentibacteria bacterium]|nr:efflux RND transporter periplasmic adaptor subunit [Candidatus Fermentibacteria bacterium]
MSGHPGKASLRCAVTALAFTAALLTLSCGPGGGSREEEPPPAVAVEVVEPTSISSIAYANARLEGSGEAMIYPGTPGKVMEVLVSEGDQVEKGQRLVRMDTDEQMAATLSGARASLEAARVNLDNARRDVERMESLHRAGAVSSQQLERARAGLEAAQAQYDQARAGLEQARTAVSTSWIAAPFDGTVVRVWATEGQMISGIPVVSVASDSFFTARVLLPEETVYDLEPGQPAFIEVPALDGEAFPGVVTAVSSAVDAQSGLVPTRVRFETAGGKLRPGTSGRVGVQLRTFDDAVAVKESMLKRTRMGFQVVVVEGGTASVRDVETGISNDGRVQITSGLQPGDSLVVRGQNTLSDGDEVRVVR